MGASMERRPTTWTLRSYRLRLYTSLGMVPPSLTEHHVRMIDDNLLVTLTEHHVRMTDDNLLVTPYLNVVAWYDLAGVAQATSTLMPMFSARLWM